MRWRSASRCTSGARRPDDRRRGGGAVRAAPPRSSSPASSTTPARSLHLGTLAETPVEVDRATVDLNLTRPCSWRGPRSGRRTSCGGAGGVLVNVSSGAATLGAPGEYVQYAAAKAGVDDLTVGVAQEVAADGVRVVGVAPGIVGTTIHADAGDAGRVDRVGPRSRWAGPVGRGDGGSRCLAVE